MMEVLANAKSAKLRGDAPYSGGQISKDQLRIEAKDAIAEAAQLLIPACIGRALADMTTTIDFDHEVNFGSEEIHDEPVDGHLAAKDNAELLSGKAAPQEQLRRSGVETHGVSPSGEQRS
jgi:hypothetical protein